MMYRKQIRPQLRAGGS